MEQDAPVYNTDDESDKNRQILTTVFKRSPDYPLENSSVRILTVLDAVNTNPKWQRKLNIYYKVITHDVIVGYMHSQLINKIVYKNC